ncbi:hypothetical protein [Nitratireductor sp. GCM10026969]|uniref:hypothetical protein n=1 Tax=Nitratireductor sp. GCM10026969 TaxID=3252645 RepID=UPI0036214A1A
MEKVRETAFVCIGRAVLFGGFAVVLVMLSFSFDMVLALYAGAVLMLVMAEILILKAFAAPWQNPKKTEVWGCLDERARPAAAAGRMAFAAVLREVYGRFARNSYAVACSFFAASLVLRGLGM